MTARRIWSPLGCLKKTTTTLGEAMMSPLMVLLDQPPMMQP
jgi:hypothetical protein